MRNQQRGQDGSPFQIRGQAWKREQSLYCGSSPQPRGIQLPAAPFGFWRAAGHVAIGIFAAGVAIDSSLTQWTIGQYVVAFLVAYVPLALVFEAIRYLVRRVTH